MSYHDYAISGLKHAHQRPMQRLKIVKKEKLTERPEIVGGNSVDLYRFTMSWGETGKSFAMLIPYDWDAGDWIKDRAACGLEWPIELRLEGVAIASRASPFS